MTWLKIKIREWIKTEGERERGRERKKHSVIYPCTLSPGVGWSNIEHDFDYVYSDNSTFIDISYEEHIQEQCGNMHWIAAINLRFVVFLLWTKVVSFSCDFKKYQNKRDYIWNINTIWYVCALRLLHSYSISLFGRPSKRSTQWGRTGEVSDSKDNKTTQVTPVNDIHS